MALDHQYIDADALLLDTRLPEGRRVEGLEYGGHVSRIGWNGYYVRPDGTARWGVARLTPASDDLADCDPGETQDAAIVRCIADELTE